MPTGCVRALLATVLFLRPINSPAEEPQGKKPAVDVPTLIDKLVDVDESDYGYSSTVNGSGFLPLDREGHFEGGMLFQKPPVPSETMRAIVKQGAAAVPHLVAHLGDKRPTRITITHSGFLGGLFHGEEYDFNPRTIKKAPGSEKNGENERVGPDLPGDHTITVGDLCYVALGQIVNRRFSAVRYQPTAIIIVNSPIASPALRAAVKEEWDGLTPAQHRASLIEDILKPDHEGRRIGACKRLAYYYPDALDEPALKVLAQPTYHGPVVGSRGLMARV
jgi:hypothetical protein